MEINIAGNLVRVEFSSNVMPKFIEKKNTNLVWFGDDNNYPAFLLDLYRKHPEHGAIVKSKAKYIYGKGLQIREGLSTIETAKGMAFLSRANRYEDWNSVFEKTVKSLELFNGFAWQVIWDIFGRKCEVFCIQLSKVRVSIDGSKVFYCNRWTHDDGKPITTLTGLEKYGFQEFDAFDPSNRKGTQIYYYRVPEQYAEETNCYPIPEYCQAIINIDTDVSISTFQHSLVGNGMSAQGMLSLFNGLPTEDEKKQLKKLFEKNHTGPNKAGSIIFNFVDNIPGQEGKGAEYTTFTVSDLDKQFEQISKTNQQKIIAGHQIPNKQLVGISQEGALSDRTAVIESFEQLTNTYTEPRQQLIIGEIKMIASLQGAYLDLEVQKLKPLGVDITKPDVAKYFDEDEIREQLGYKPRENKSVDPNVPVQQAEVNDNLKNLTGRQWQGIKRIIREVENGKVTREAATMILKRSYALTDEDINILIPASGGFASALQFASHFETERIISLFESLAIQENEGDTFISEELVTFAATREVANSVLDLLKGDPTILPERIARLLGEPSDFIIEVIDDLEKRGLLERLPGKLSPTDDGIKRRTPTVETEIYTVYKYATRDDVPAADETREFCSRLLRLSREGKRWTREAIDNISNDIGENAWSYRGGWYTNPNTGETTTHCRHVWKAVTRSRTKKNG